VRKGSCLSHPTPGSAIPAILRIQRNAQPCQCCTARRLSGGRHVPMDTIHQTLVGAADQQPRNRQELTRWVRSRAKIPKLFQGRRSRLPSGLCPAEPTGTCGNRGSMPIRYRREGLRGLHHDRSPIGSKSSRSPRWEKSVSPETPVARQRSQMTGMLIGERGANEIQIGKCFLCGAGYGPAWSSTVSSR